MFKMIIGAAFLMALATIPVLAIILAVKWILT